jgi:hypothetical protein
VFAYDGVSSSWIQVGLDIDGDVEGDQCGHTVSLSDDGSRVAVGSPRADSGGVTDAGLLRVYEYDSGNGGWVQLGQDFVGEPGNVFIGLLMALSGAGTRLLMSATTSPEQEVEIRLFEYDSVAASWTQLGTTINGQANESIRYPAFTRDGTIFAAGADDYGKPGFVRVYDVL